MFCIFFQFRTPRGLEDVSQYPNLFATLMEDPSWSEEQLKKLAGLNFIRVFSTAEQVSNWDSVCNHFTQY